MKEKHGGKGQHCLKCSNLTYKMYVYLALKGVISSGRNTKFHRQCSGATLVLTDVGIPLLPGKSLVRVPLSG